MHLPADFEIARELPQLDCSPAEAERYTRWLATHHYENFTVVSWVLPRGLRQHFYNVYAYCRWSDDLGDEVSDAARALALLDDWEQELRRCYEGRASHPVFIALRGTIEQCGIPIQPFADLLTAFRQDQRVSRYPDWNAVLDYCRYSANPVGRLVLYVCGYGDLERQRLSDATCTALQLANFWQDVSRDLDKGRIYIPLDALAAHGLTEQEILARRFDRRYVALMKDLIGRTRQLFDEGRPLVEMVSTELRLDIELFTRGGEAVLEAIERSGYDTLRHRPALSGATKLRLLGKSVLSRVFKSAPDSDGRRLTAVDSFGTPNLESSYERCREVARVAARNFYYGLKLLPAEKRDGLCALYAFMRHADDISDSPGDAREKQRRLAAWRAALDRALLGEYQDNPVLPALHDTVARFGIPSRYLHDLISGVEMDLSVTSYPTMERLREYCYRVAGTVGVCCTHVFGFRDPRALDLAERLGIAFQLTNILRDVAQDRRMGRVYLPQEDFDKFGCADDLQNVQPSEAMTRLLESLADRAWDYYKEGAGLLPLVSTDSRPALWALVRIYSGLLAKIETRGYDVFSSRVALSGGEKTWIMLRARVGWWSREDALERRDRDRRRAGGTFLRRRAG